MLLRSAPESTFASAGAHTALVLERIFLACALHDSVAGSRGKVHFASTTDERCLGTPSLQHQVVYYLLANFDLWARAPPELQFGLAASLLDLVRDNPERLRSMLSVEMILASLSVSYPDQVLNRGKGLSSSVDTSETSSSHEFGSGPSANVVEELDADRKGWIKMARRERQHMRGCLWEVIRLLLCESTNQEDGTAMIHLLASCDDAQVVRDRPAS